MERVALAGTPLTVSRACLGAMTFGAQTDEPTAALMVDRCLDTGVNFFDTANVYNAGRSEEILGRVLGARRKDVVVASKVGGRMGRVTPDTALLRREQIIAECEASLKRLGTDYIDLYYLHQPDYNVPVAESLAALDHLVNSGKVRAIASSNYASWQVTQMHWIAESEGLVAPRVAQPMLNILARDVDSEFLPMCRELGVATIVYNPLAAGLLTGKHRPDVTPGDTRFALNPMYKPRFWHDAMFSAVEALKTTAERDQRSLVSIALNWILHHSGATGVLLGASKIEQLDENLAALNDGPLSEQAVNDCDAVWAQLRGITPQYNR